MTDLGPVLTQLAATLHDERTESPTLDAVVGRAVELVADAECASVTVRRRRRHATLVSTDRRAAEADALQYEAGEGPCVEVSNHVDWLRSGDVGRDRRWPVWGPLAAQQGIGSLLSVPLIAREERIGALNLYSGRTGAFATREILDFALLFGVHAALAMSSAKLVTGLETALGSRHTIGVAQGVIMERFGLDLDQSFALLSRLSSHTNVRLATICEQIVRTGRLPK